MRQIKLNGRALLPLGVDERAVIVHDNEPTSAVAFSLSSKHAPTVRLCACCKSSSCVHCQLPC